MNSSNSTGWISGCRHVASPHCDARPAGVVPELLVIHCISLPEGAYANGYIEQLFCGTLDCNSDPSFESLKGLRVSSHFVIARDGTLTQFVDMNARAWHAGVSRFQGKDACNDFSIGVELEGCVNDDYAPQQIQALITLCGQITKKFPSLHWVAGHSDIAPGRKADPGSRFPWPEFLSECHLQGISLTRPSFG